MPMNTPLSPATIESLQGRELDAAVAELMGWVWLAVEGGQAIIVPPDYKSGRYGTWLFNLALCDSKTPRYSEWTCASNYTLPRYSQSLDLFREVENEIERRGLTEQYVEALSEIVAPDCIGIYSSAIEIDTHHGMDGHKFVWLLVHASPEQKARAALKAVSGG